MSSPRIGNYYDKTKKTSARTPNKSSIVCCEISPSENLPLKTTLPITPFPAKTLSFKSKINPRKHSQCHNLKSKKNSCYEASNKYDTRSNSIWHSYKSSLICFISSFMTNFIIKSSKLLYISSIFSFFHSFLSLILCKTVSLVNRSFHNLFKSIPFCSLLVLFVLCCANDVGASEFPERECCDPIYPVATSTSAPPPSAVTVPAGKPGLNVRTSIAILNCLLARQLCFEDASCSAILEIIPRVCGSELVACSTVTVTKCQAALRTLQAFPFFKPTCLCKEPNVDPECNSFRDFLFDHPCVFVLKKEKDPYPVEALPTCNYALNVCHSEKACAALFDTFKLACRARDGDCKMDDKDQCREAWAGLRMSPLFGCICPNNHMKKRCDRIFAMVNHNPCVVNAVSQDGKRLPPSIASGNKTSPDTESNQNNNENNWVSGVDLGPEEGFELDDHHISPHIMEEGHRRIFGRPGRRKGGTHHWKHQDGPKRIGSNDEGHEGSPPRVSLKSTCQLALDRCIRDKSCTASLTPILQTCDNARCDREGCMEALRNFYRTPNVQWNLEIAFCLCKKTDNKEDACMNAQEKLHPVCAQREPGVQVPFCHVLAQTCRENPECRMRLEQYEQSCAVDSVTKRCAGSPEACRTAVLNMLGTDLRTACACKGTEYNHLYDCLGWQRLLWLNPCVVESQSDFHIRTYGSTSTPAFDNGIRTIHEISSENGGKLTTSVMIPPTTTTTQQPSVVFVTQAPKTFVNTHEETKIGRNIEVEIVQGGNKEQEAIIVVAETTTLRTTTTTEEQTTIIVTTTPSTTTTTEMETTTRSTTTSTTPEPIKYCIVQRPELDDQFVQKGHTKRLYRDAELDCSELCHCDNHLSVSCHAVCVRHAPCRTALAYYSHAAPAYQAYRGRCYCYSGSFICMRPNPGEYSLPPGVYLLLGFSSQDEALLRPHTRLGLEDAVRVLQEYMLTIADDGTNCTLTLFNVTNENMIITASVPSNQRDNLPNSPIAILDNDKMECIDLLETLKSKINSQDYEISSHLLLSIFKIAEVDIIYPPPSSAGIARPSLLLILTATFIILILQDRSYTRSVLHIVSHKLDEICTNVFAQIMLIVSSHVITRTYNVISLALETFAHFFYFSREIVMTAMIFFHFFPQHDCNDKNKIVHVKIHRKNDMLTSVVKRAPFFKMAVNDFVMSKVMPSARLFYEKMCFVYTLIGTIIPCTYLLALRRLTIINVYKMKHISIAVNILLLYCYNLSVKMCIFCRKVHLESMTYSIYRTIDVSLLTCYLLFVVNFAESAVAFYCKTFITTTDVFSSRIKTETIFLQNQGLIGVQDGEIIRNIIIKNTDCLQNIFLNNILHMETLKILLIVLCTTHAAAAILSLFKMASHVISQHNLTNRISVVTSLLMFSAMFTLFQNNLSLISDDILENVSPDSGNISLKHCEYSLTGVTPTCECVSR